MKNIFPKAELAEIEDIIGIKRPSAHPKIDQIPRGQTNPPEKQDFSPFAVYPKWFDMNKISDYENNFFSNSDYLDIRNKILNLYINARSELTIQMCGDLVCHQEFLKIFDFLEDSNIINYEIGLKLEVLHLKANLSNLDSLENHKNVSVDEKQSIPDQFICNSNKKVFSKYLKRDVLETSTCNCGNRAEFFTSELFFICNECLNTRAYPDRYTLRNFHKITPDLLQAIWTKEEEYLLLKNIETYGDDWKMVSSGLNKSISQCIFHFIKMPLIDQCDSFPVLPFSSLPNQISTFVSYIASMVHPVVSAEVAKHALKCLSKPNIMEILLTISVDKAKDVLELEKSKKSRLEKVEIEALVKRINFKIEAIREMFSETGMVRVELEDGRERLIEELSKK